MNAPSANDALHIVNRTAVPARVRLIWAGLRIFDVWVGPAGAVTAPRFVPPRVMVEARMTDRTMRVTYAGSTRLIASTASVTARLERHSGANLFVLHAQEGVVAGALHLANSCAEPIEYVARYADSPYVLTGCLAAGAARSIKYGQMELAVICEGISVLHALPAPQGRWVIETLPGAAGFTVGDATGHLDEYRDLGVAAPIALHGTAN